MLASDRCNNCNNFYKNTISSRDEHLCSRSLRQTGLQTIPSVASGQEVFVLLLGLWSLFSVSPFVFGLAFFDC